MEEEFGMVLPKQMHPEFAAVVQRLSEEKGTEIRPHPIWEVFEREYLSERGPLCLKQSVTKENDGTGGSRVFVEAVILVDGSENAICGAGNGPIDAFADALKQTGFPFRVTDYSEHALSSGSDSRAAAYVRVEGRRTRRPHGASGSTPTSTWPRSERF